jgi:hypothetical protein
MDKTLWKPYFGPYRIWYSLQFNFDLEIITEATPVKCQNFFTRLHARNIEHSSNQYISLTFGNGDLHLIQINHQPDPRVFQFIILTFVYSSTCFGPFPAHHREINDCSGSLWFYLRIVATVVLCSWSGRPAGPTTNTARLSPRYEGITRGCHCSHWAPDDRRKNTRNMLSCKQTSG